MQTIADLKLLLLQMLEDSFQEPNIQATQQMGVNMSNAVKREGVIIIQNQNVEIYARIMPLMVKALKMCDSIEVDKKYEIIQERQKQIEAPPVINDDTDPIEESCAWMFENNIGWEDMQDIMKKRYAEYVIKQFKTKKEAAKFLKIGGTYLCRITALTTNKELGS